MQPKHKGKDNSLAGLRSYTVPLQFSYQQD
jgi:hypothetical protein